MADAGILDAVTASLGPDQIRAFFARQMAELPQPLTPEDRQAGYGYALSMLQVEVSDTRVFDRPVRARQWFEATIGEQLTLGRPERIGLLFGRRVTRATKGRFETRVVDAYTTPTITFRYKHSTIKQYLKEGCALRTETTFNDAYDFAVGRRLDNLAALRTRGEAINAALLEHEANAETARLEGPELSGGNGSLDDGGVSEPVVVPSTATTASARVAGGGLGAGWRGRIRTFDLLIQSQMPGSGLASHVLSVRQASIGRRIGVSQVPIPK